MANYSNRCRVVTAEEIRRLLDYVPETGQLIWREAPSHNTPHLVGTVAGNLDRYGRRCVMIHKKNYFAHRLIWLHVHGVWPVNVIDHVNRDPSDNRIGNLREATRSQNMGNRRPVPNQTGFMGVLFEASRRKWRASLRTNGKRVILGRFDTAEEAAAAYRSAKLREFGSFAYIE